MAQSGSGKLALRRVLRQRPDVVLLEARLPDMSAVECLRRIKSELPSVQVVMLTEFDDTELIFATLKAGACGYLLKRTPLDRLIVALKEISEGGSPMTCQIARKLVDYFNELGRAPRELGRLSPREQEILRLLSTGSRVKEIAESLHISVETARTHVRHIYDKLHVRTRTEAVLRMLGR